MNSKNRPLRSSDAPISLVGLRISASRLYDGAVFKGTVVNETKNMLWIRLEDGSIKKLPKEVLRITLEDWRGLRLSALGRDLIGRPEERVKKKRHGWA